MEKLTQNVLGEPVFDKGFSEKILEKLNAANDYREEILQSNDAAACFTLLEKIMVIFKEISESKHEFVSELKDNRIFKQAECVVYSIYNIMQDFEKTASLENALHRIEFETFPIIEETIATFIYFNFAALEKESEEEFWNPETGRAKDLWFNRYVKESEKTGEYKYEVSIVVYAFNHCDITKQCVESLLKWIPSDLNYELILFNHGSTDGVKSYFESVKPTKQIDIKINSCSLMHCVHRVLEGKYYLQVSNDVIITPNAVENMLRACKDDPRIGYIVPSTPNVSGFQRIDIGEYSTVDELNVLAAKNNIYDPKRHEERVALCNPIGFYPTSLYFEPDILISGKIYRIDEHKYAFPDDLTSFLIRRKGFKVILQKDAYCHHIGSVTLRTEKTDEDKVKSLSIYKKKSEIFKQYYGANPWSVGKCHVNNISGISDYINNIIVFEGRINILGINCGLGADPLKIKALYKELKGNSDVHITNYTNFSWFETDLKTVSEKAVYTEDLMALLKTEKPESYNHVVMVIPENKEYHTQEFIDMCFDLLIYGGSLFIWLIEDYDVNDERIDKIVYNKYPFEIFVKK